MNRNYDQVMYHSLKSALICRSLFFTLQPGRSATLLRLVMLVVNVVVKLVVKAVVKLVVKPQRLVTARPQCHACLFYASQASKASSKASSKACSKAAAPP